MHNTRKTYYFLGIGGIGMSALARYFKKQGCDVSGYDKTPSQLAKQLVEEGIDVHYEENIEKIPSQADLVVYTPAIPEDNKEYQFILKNGFLIKKRAEVLSELTNNLYSIAIAGTHGKTTITGMIAHILFSAGTPVNAFVGGIIKNYNSNLITCENAEIAVLEADEYDRSFLWLTPDIAIVSAMDADHLDIYSNKQNLQDNFRLFAQKIKENGNLLIKKDLDINANKNINSYRYSLQSKTDFYAKDIRIEDSHYCFTACLRGEEVPVLLQIPGMHNVENAMAAIAACFLAGVNSILIKKGIESFMGISRRFDIRYEKKNMVYIDDYAHHPEEMKAVISTLRDLYPGKKKTGIFQPHLFSRTLHFADEFAKTLDMLDEAILMEIYPARETPIEGVTSDMLLKKMIIDNKKILSENEICEFVRNNNIEVLITMGAGDIDRLVLPIVETLEKK